MSRVVPEPEDSEAARVGTHSPSVWSAMDVAKIASSPIPETSVIGPAQAFPMFPELTLWDLWPIQTDDGALAQIDGGTLWVILSAPRTDDPNARHDIARMWLFHRIDAEWRDCGPLMPDGFTPGSREWSGSTRLDPHTGRVTLWFTAAGRREGGARFEQRLFLACGQLDTGGDRPHIARWSDLKEALPNEGSAYADTATAPSMPGRIKGFRDPFWFRDPADGVGYLLFTASQRTERSVSEHDGVIGIARATDANGVCTFSALPPLIDASGVSNELELPHVVVKDGLYYLFWCTQTGVFAPEVTAGPTGLYGMVASSLCGPYKPLNGSGLVLANPAAEPRQAYGWRVLPTLDVMSFVDFWGVKGRDLDTDRALLAAQFGGTIGPMSRIEIAGNRTRIVATAS